MKKIMASGLALVLLLGLFISSTGTNAAAKSSNVCEQYKGVTKVWWDGGELKSAQIGRLTVLQDTTLFSLNGDQKMVSRTLKAGEFYRIYAFKPGMLSVGGGYYVNRDTKVKYETPSKAKLLAVQCAHLPGWVSTGGKTYYVDQSGAVKTGWLDVSGKKYFLNSDGTRAENTTVDGRKLGADGAWIGVHYVALGDSLAAGMTPNGEDREGDLGYPDYIKEDFAKTYQLLDYTNFGVSGYTADSVLADLGKSEVQTKIKEATHLTIDIGANDLLPVIKTNPAQAPTVVASVAAKLNTILSTIDQLNPTVKVYVMGYYNPFPYLTDAQQKAQLDQLLLAFNGQIQAQAVQHGDTFVPTAQVLNVENFAEYIPNPLNIHLSPAGYQAVAAEFWKVMN